MILTSIVFFTKPFAALGRLLTQPDPVKDCEVYKDQLQGSCAHVDGPECLYPDCVILSKRRNAEKS